MKNRRESVETDMFHARFKLWLRSDLIYHHITQSLAQYEYRRLWCTPAVSKRAPQLLKIASSCLHYQHIYPFCKSETMSTLLRLNLIVNLCWEAWPQLCLIDSFVTWMWYLPRERCLLLAPHEAMLSLHLPPSPFSWQFFFKCIDPERKPACWSE